MVTVFKIACNLRRYKCDYITLTLLFIYCVHTSSNIKSPKSNLVYCHYSFSGSGLVLRIESQSPTHEGTATAHMYSSWILQYFRRVLYTYLKITQRRKVELKYIWSVKKKVTNACNFVRSV
jgi:hypothetical protein